MSQGGNILYRCRRCKTEFVDGHSPDWTTGLLHAYEGLAIKPSGECVYIPELFTFHWCDGTEARRVGLADLIGADPDAK